MGRRCVADRLDPRRVRPFPPHRPALGAGRMGGLRLLRQPLPLLLGPPAAPGGHPRGLPVTFALANPKIDERDVAIGLFDSDPDAAGRPRRPDPHRRQGLRVRRVRAPPRDHGIELVRPRHAATNAHDGAPANSVDPPDHRVVNATLKTKLSLERHGGHSHQGVLVRVLQRLLALTAAIWHNHHTGQPVLRSLTAYDHCRVVAGRSCLPSPGSSTAAPRPRIGCMPTAAATLPGSARDS